MVFTINSWFCSLLLVYELLYFICTARDVILHAKVSLGAFATLFNPALIVFAYVNYLPFQCRGYWNLCVHSQKIQGLDKTPIKMEWIVATNNVTVHWCCQHINIYTELSSTGRL